MAGANNVDMEMHSRVKEPLPEEKKKDLLMIQAGGLWTGCSLAKAGYLANGLCPWCGIEDEDLEHLWWRCPCHEQWRGQVRRLLPHGWEYLPPCLAQHGIPPEPAGKLDGPRWRACDCNLDAGPPPEETELIGDTRLAWAEVSQLVEQELRLQQPTANLEDLTIRQVAQWINGDYLQLPPWNIEACPTAEEGPCTAFSDGGVEGG